MGKTARTVNAASTVGASNTLAGSLILQKIPSRRGVSSLGTQAGQQADAAAAVATLADE